MDLPTDCDGCGKKFLVPHTLPCPKVDLVLVRHNNSTKEWGALFSQALNPSYISYEPKINSRTVQGESNWDRARFATGSQYREVNEGVEGAMVKITVPDDSRTDASVHGFWKWCTSAVLTCKLRI